MKKLTPKQLKIIEPLKKINERFYQLQVMNMTHDAVMNQGRIAESSMIVKSFTKEQIELCQKIRLELKEYENSIQCGLDMIQEGTKLLERMTK